MKVAALTLALLAVAGCGPSTAERAEAHRQVHLYELHQKKYFAELELENARVRDEIARRKHQKVDTNLVVQAEKNLARATMQLELAQADEKAAKYAGK